MKHIYIILLFGASMSDSPVAAQPYLDLVNYRIVKSPDAGIINRNKDNIHLTYYNLSTTLPIPLKNKKDVIIISPFFEKWQILLTAEHNIQHYYGIALPVSYLKKIHQNWNLMLTGIVRANDSTIGHIMKLQAGGAIISSHTIRKHLTLKFGAYVNQEYFGLFVMPLAGIDWQINTGNCIFGVLPGNITYQHLLSPELASGLVFRAQTNSYNRQGGNYTRVDENQLGAFIDIYLSRNFIVNLEAGHSFFRSIRRNASLGCVNGNCNLKYDNHAVNDNVYFKLALAYRVKLR